MKNVVKAFGLAIALVSISAHAAVQPAAQKETKLCDFAPKNDLRIPEGLERTGGIDRAAYDKAIDLIEKYYKSIVAKAGGELVINRMWSTAEVNSNATRKGKQWIINAFGGLARFDLMTFDGEVMVLCHEMGHHMGGFPQYPGMLGASWAANEGQSDYFATMKCFRRVIENDDNETILSTMSIPAEVSRGCQLGFKDAKEIAICKRSAMTGKVLADVLYKLGHSSSSSEPMQFPQFDTPTTTQVSTTNNNHPQAQCRLDTYFAGAICGVSQDIAFSKTEGTTGACNQERGDAFGYRPRCWYKPAGTR
jgi:hypothetical protein